MTTSNAHGAAYDAVTGHDNRSDQERAAADQRTAQDTVTRLQTKRDKIAQQLADADQALADAEAELERGH